MEFCQNGDIQGFLRNKRCTNRAITESQILKMLLQICLGVLSLHDRKILHRDLKSQNVFLSKSNDVRVGDFGLARLCHQSIDSPAEETKTGGESHDFFLENTMQVGTPFYLAPELLYAETKGPYSVKSDVWAIGVILYELCALRKPFSGENQTELYQRISNDKIYHIKSISNDLMSLINRMLQKDPNRRPTL